MLIANPMYDTSFKFLMEDEEAAKIIIGTIIGAKVTSLEAKPQERTVWYDISSSGGGEKKENQSEKLSIMRVDFKAKIVLAGGVEKSLGVEVQKVRAEGDLARFRRYLSDSLKVSPPPPLLLPEKKTNGQTRGKKSTKSSVSPLPVPPPVPHYSIYLLGSGYENLYPGEPILYVYPEVYADVNRQRRLPGPVDFVELMHHSSCIVSVFSLSDSARSDVDRLLSLFTQRHLVPGSSTILDLPEGDALTFPDSAFYPVVRRLRKAADSPEVRRLLDAEEEYWEKEFLTMQRREYNEYMLAKQEAALAEQESMIAEQESVITEQAKEMEKMREEMERMRRELGKKKK